MHVKLISFSHTPLCLSSDYCQKDVGEMEQDVFEPVFSLHIHTVLEN